jgi:hypothetical protein
MQNQEMESLNLANLDVEALERRVELSSLGTTEVALVDGGEVDNCGVNGKDACYINV